MDGIIAYVNGAFLKLLDCSESLAIGHPVSFFWHDPGTEDDLVATVCEKNKYSDEIVAEVHGGQQQPLGVDASILTDAEKPVGILWWFFPSIESERAYDGTKSLLLAIRSINQVIAQESDFDTMIKKTCSSLVEVRGYLSCTVAVLTDDGESIRPVAYAGDCRVKEDWTVTPEGVGSGPDCILDAMKTGEVKVIDSGSDCVDCTYRAQYGPNPYWTVTVPMTDHERTIGFLQVIVQEREELDEQEVGLLREIVSDLSFARSKSVSDRAKRVAEENLRRLNRELESLVENRTSELREANTALRERMKEITCLYTISQILRNETAPVETIMQDLIEPIEQGLQYPDITKVRIRWGDQALESSGFRETDWMVESHTQTLQDDLLEITVTYSEERPTEDFGPFLDEELVLIDQIANLIAGTTSMRQIQDSLRDREQQLSMAIEGGAIGIVATDTSGEILDANKAFGRLLGYSKEELLAMSLWDLILPDDRPRAKGSVQTLLDATEMGASFEVQCCRKDGCNVITIFNASVVRDSAGLPNRLFIQVQDITEMRNLQRRYELIANTIPGGCALGGEELNHIDHRSPDCFSLP